MVYLLNRGGLSYFEEGEFFVEQEEGKIVLI